MLSRSEVVVNDLICWILTYRTVQLKFKIILQFLVLKPGDYIKKTRYKGCSRTGHNQLGISLIMILSVCIKLVSQHITTFELLSSAVIYGRG